MAITAKNNKFDKIKEDPGSKGLDAKQLIHAKLKIDQDRNGAVVFSTNPYVLLSADVKIPEREAERIAVEVADGKHPGGKAAFEPSPYDISVEVQSWIVIELEPDTPQWQFCVGSPACTGKAEQTGRNCRVRNVYPSNHPKKPGVCEPGDVSEDGCRVILLGVSERGWKKDPDGHEYVNLHTEFVQGAHRLIVIFDPDIPNGGSNTIP